MDDPKLNEVINYCLRTIKEAQALGFSSTDIQLYDENIADIVEKMFINLGSEITYQRHKLSFEIFWPKGSNFH
jgi:hypothetical protein